MNLFRSEEHAKNWSGYKDEAEDGLIPLADLIKMFSGNYFKKRRAGGWVSNHHQYARELVSIIIEIGKGGDFWLMPKK